MSQPTTTKTSNIINNGIPEEQTAAAYVFVPADPEQAMQELTIDLSDNSNELSIFLDELKKHYRKQKRSQQGKMNQIESLKQELQKNSANNANMNMNDIDFSVLSKATSFEMVGTVQLMPCIPNIGGKRQPKGSLLYRSIQMYIDDNGQFKKYQRNVRAESITNACGAQRNSPILGDVFISMYYDDEDNFRRLNFSLQDCDSQSRWFKEACKRNGFKMLKAESCHHKNCAKKGSSRCGRCLLVWYCSKDCQRADWKQHKKVCIKSKA